MCGCVRNAYLELERCDFLNSFIAYYNHNLTKEFKVIQKKNFGLNIHSNLEIEKYIFTFHLVFQNFNVMLSIFCTIMLYFSVSIGLYILILEI